MWSLPVECAAAPDVDERHEEKEDEDQDLGKDEDRIGGLKDRADRIQEDDLDVEQDEEHRDHVEGDAEAKGLRHFARQAALVRLGLHLVRPRRSEERVGRHQETAHQYP